MDFCQSFRVLVLLLALYVTEIRGAARNFGSAFYHSHINYTHFNLPDLANANQTSYDFHQFDDFSHVRLRHAYPFFGRLKRSFVFTLHGFVTPQWVPCSGKFGDKYSDQCAPYLLSRMGNMSPLSGQWHADLGSKTVISLAEDRDGKFVHFRWYETHTDILVCEHTVIPTANHSREFIKNQRKNHQHCKDSPDTTFSTTLFANGTIVFNYEKLGNKSAYGRFGATHTYLGGRIGLKDSFIEYHELDLSSPYRFHTYADLDVSHAFTVDKKPKSIIFHPVRLTHCAGATSRSACRNHNDRDHDDCYWCENAAPMWQETASFCTNGNDAYAFYVTHSGCEAKTSSKTAIGLAVGLSLGLLALLALGGFVAFYFGGPRLKQQFSFSRFGGSDGLENGEAPSSSQSQAAGTDKESKAFDDVNLS